VSENRNFAAQLLGCLTERSHLTDAATGQTFQGAAVAESIVGFAAGFLWVCLQPGDRLMICCSLNPASALAYLGAMYAGLIPVLVEERAFADLGEPLFRKAQAKALWTDTVLPSDWAKRDGIPHLQGSFAPRPVESLAPAPCEENDLAALMPTSGSTGYPNLVMVSHRNLTANTEAIVRSQNLGRDETAMLILPISYCFGASVLHTHLRQGSGVVFDSRFMFPDKVLHAINRYNCTTFAGVPTVYNILLGRSNLKSISLPSLRRFLQAGGALAAEKVQEMRRIAPQAQFYVMYGQTEATSRISCLPPGRLSDKLGSVGLPLDNIVVRVADDRGGELPIGQTGEIQALGPSISSGYFNEPEASARKFRNGWLKTGDLGCRDEDGYLWIRGRRDEFIKIRGLRVGFAEVEARVAAIPGIYECAATAVPHQEAGDALALFVVANSGINGIAERVRSALPPQWTCASVNVVAELPKTPTGKIARLALQSMV
jgi:acyl-CoA synthetase (AMP-forming)/AMP-acid ligase II